DLLVIHDELDLPWGRIQIRKGGGAAGHHGIESIIDSIGTRDFLRLRLGIAPERNGERDEQERVRYLLRPVPRAARKAMAALIEEAAGAAEMLIAEGPAKAMNRYNRRDLAGGQKPGEAKDREKKQAGGTAGHETGSN